MKRFIIFTLLFICVCMAVAQEGHRTTWIQTSDGSLDWILHPAAACSSKVFPLYYHMTWKGFFNDTSDVLNDSCQYMVQLFTSSTALTTIDTTFTLAHTVFNAPAEFDGDSTIAFWGGPTRPKSMFEAAERFGFFRITVLSTGSQIDSAIIGRMYINGWSNQSGAVLSKIGN